MDPMMPLTAPPDAGAGSGKAASSKPSVADQLQDVDTSVLDRLNTIREEESRLAAFRTRASEMKGQVSDQVYRRVVDDYNKRATSLEQQATPLKTKGRAEYRKLHVLIGDVTRIRDQARLEKEELEFRHAVGELDDPDLRTGLEAPQGRLDQCEADLARIDEYSNRFIEAFGTKEALEAPEPVAPPPPAPRSSGVTAKPVPSTAPGMIGTPAARIAARAAVLEPISSIAAGGGPIHVSPASSTARAKPAFSARKPYPG